MKKLELVEKTSETDQARIREERAEPVNALADPGSGKPHIPREYRDLVEVFSEKSDMLFPHRPTDCAIEMKLPKPKMYVMTQGDGGVEEFCGQEPGERIHSARKIPGASPCTVQQERWFHETVRGFPLN